MKFATAKRQASNPLVIEFGQNESWMSWQADVVGRLNRSLRFVTDEHCAGPDENELVTEWIRETLASLPAGKQPTATVCVSRSSCCIHLLHLKAAPIDQMADLVALEMESAFGEQVDDHTWDYVLAANAALESEQLVVVYSIRKSLLEEVQQVLTGVGVKVGRVTLFEPSLPLNDEKSIGEIKQIIALRGNTLDILVSGNGSLYQSQSLSINPESVVRIDQLIGTLRRLWASLPEGLNEHRAESLLLIERDEYGNENSTIYRDSLVRSAKDAGFRIQLCDFLDVFQNCKREPCQVLDFLNPKRAVSSGVSKRSKAVAAACVVLATLFFVLGYSRYQTDRIRDLLLTQRAELAKIEDLKEGMRTQYDAAQQLKEWERSAVRWDEHIDQLITPFGNSDAMYIVRMEMDSPRVINGRPLTRLEGRSKSPGDILTLIRQLTERNSALSVQPNGIEPSGIDPDFGSQFRIEITSAGVSTFRSTHQTVDSSSEGIQ
ncbi:hypothetical protein SH139x_003238 [Planctomycetaceae bacterium SH139]